MSFGTKVLAFLSSIFAISGSPFMLAIAWILKLPLIIGQIFTREDRIPDVVNRLSMLENTVKNLHLHLMELDTKSNQVDESLNTINAKCDACNERQDELSANISAIQETSSIGYHSRHDSINESPNVTSDQEMSKDEDEVTLTPPLDRNKKRNRSFISKWIKKIPHPHHHHHVTAHEEH
ncbi:hypothetical protein HDE_00278 [Halotydeus destructor]|nr:hypothetical protein HDE_00278 [Halotydeus destructor]